MKRVPKKAIETLLRHALADIDFGWDGSYGGGNTDGRNGGINRIEVKEAQRAIEWIKSNLIT